ncbi:MAG: FtsX-like permease family protein [Gemmatimonadales bacterium]
MPRTNLPHGTGASAFQGLRHSWQLALFVSFTAAVALGAILPAMSLRGAGGAPSRLRLDAAGGLNGVLPWSQDALSPAALQTEAAARLVTLLMVAAGGALLIALFATLALSAARASSRLQEVNIRRAVGASRTTLLLASLLEGAAMAGLAAGIGLLAAALATRLTLAGWPGSIGPGRWTPMLVAALAITGAIVAGALLPMLFARTRRIGESTARRPEPWALAVQLGFGLVVMTAGSQLGRAVPGNADAADTAETVERTGNAAISGNDANDTDGSPVPSASSVDHPDRSRDCAVPRDCPRGPRSDSSAESADPSASPAIAPTRLGVVYRITGSEMSAAARAERYARLLGELDRDPTVAAASMGNPGLAIGLGVVDHVTTDCGMCAQGGIFAPWHTVRTTTRLVSPDSFEALNVKLIEGRGIESTDGWDAPKVAVINRLMAARHFQYGQAIGRALKLGSIRSEWYTVVGVVDEPEPRGFGGTLLPLYSVYLSVLQAPPDSVELLVRGAAGGAVRPAVVRTLGTGTRIEQTGEAMLLAAQARPVAWFARLFGLVGWGIFVIALGGAFVLMGSWMRSMLTEIGIRRAVGATRWHLLWFFFRRVLAVAGGGALIGLWLGPTLWDSLPEVVSGLAWPIEAAVNNALLLAGAALAGMVGPALLALRAAPGKLLAK